MKHFYVYYSYEEYGRGYIGKRECKCLPEKDIKYFGSYKDKTFKPTQKIILDIFDSRELALEAECILHEFYNIDKNPHFANRAKQTSTKFYYNQGPSQIEIEKKRVLMRTDFNPMSNPELKEKARKNLIIALNDPEVRKRKSESAKKVFNEPKMKEKRRQTVIKSHQNPETKRKHIEAKLGSKNPCFGKKWITNGTKNKYINDFDEVLSGFWYGRTLQLCQTT